MDYHYTHLKFKTKSTITPTWNSTHALPLHPPGIQHTVYHYTHLKLNTVHHNTHLELNTQSTTTPTWNWTHSLPLHPPGIEHCLPLHPLGIEHSLPLHPLRIEHCLPLHPLRIEHTVYHYTHFELNTQSTTTPTSNWTHSLPLHHLELKSNLIYTSFRTIKFSCFPSYFFTVINIIEWCVEDDVYRHPPLITNTNDQ
jgi:hypothetical protein